MAFVHSRVLNYQKAGFKNIWVLNFSAERSYRFEGVSVITLGDYAALRAALSEEQGTVPFALFISHAPNLRNHYRFLKAHAEDSRSLMFFFHGHEVLNISRVYPEPYAYQKKQRLQNAVQELYDRYKLRLWRRYYPRVAERSRFVFVSRWMQDEFFQWTRIRPEQLLGHCHVIYNNISPYFEQAHFQPDPAAHYDFISIRTILDGSKYCADLINQLALRHPERRFLLIGKGDYFKHNEKAPNLDVEYRFVPQNELFQEILRARCALMPTRLDAQGVMACEMASCGMPLISSDIAVCREVFAGFDNVRLIANAAEQTDLTGLLEELLAGLPYAPNQKYCAKNTTDLEAVLIREVCAQVGVHSEAER